MSGTICGSATLCYGTSFGVVTCAMTGTICGVATLCYGKRLWCGKMCYAMAQAVVLQHCAIAQVVVW